MASDVGRASPPVADDKGESSEKPRVEALSISDSQVADAPAGGYRLYKRRWVGVFVLFIAETVASMSWPWFGPIATQVKQDMGYSIDRVDWLGNMIACAYLVIAFQVPLYVRYFGVRKTTIIGGVFLVISAWIRYAGTARSLSSNGSYALVILGQFFAGLAQPIFQILAPKYSELWFDLKTRTTATMIISIANPIGGAIGQLLSPAFPDTRQGILVLGIISTAAAPLVLLVSDKPPTPPTYAGSKHSPGIHTLLLAMIGKETHKDAHMTVRERLDFAIVVWVFAVLLAAINTFSVLSSDWLSPYGYSSDTSGFMGAALLLAGIVAALVTAPLFDRVFTSHIALVIRVLCPTIGAGWLGLIWAVKKNDDGALYALFAIIGACSVALLPIGTFFSFLLGAELTRNADGSSATLWFFGNLMCIIFILAQGALRAPSTANPPLNMHRSIIFNGAWCFASSFFVFFLHGRQVRRERDVAMQGAEQLSEEAGAQERA
ncbi:MFS general substrate transporter [Peniophora sp. CONT]|nr:MFS general substrate transporter [Peniophora sp. CONT]